MRIGRTRYRVSPLNLFVAICTVGLLVSPLFVQEGFGGVLTLLYLTPFFILGLVVDFVIQLLSKSFRFAVLLELVIIILVFMLVLAFRQ